MTEEIQSMKNFRRTGTAGGVVKEGSQLGTNKARVAESEETVNSNQFGALTREERKRLGVKDEEVTYAARNPEFWQRMEGKNRVQELAREHGYARVLTNSDGTLPMDGTDTILVAVPREGMERRDQIMRQELDKDMGSLQEIDTDEGAYLQSDDNWQTMGNEEIPFTREDRRLMHRLRDQNRAIARASALMGPGSPTFKKSLRAAESMYTPEQIEAEEAMHRGRIQQTEMTTERWKAMTSAPDAKKQASSMFGFSNTGFPRNPNSPVAQAARRRPTST
jgi:hypothetical protein